MNKTLSAFCLVLFFANNLIAQSGGIVIPTIVINDEGTFRVRASSLNFIGSGIVVTSTGRGAIVDVTVSTAGLATIDLVAASTANKATVDMVNSTFTAAASTGAALTRLTDAVAASTQNITTRADAVAVATTTPISIFDEGTFQGDVSSFNCTGDNVACTVTGGTATINVTGGTAINPFTIVIGTLGAIAGTVDIASNNVDGLNEALRRLGAAGLTVSSTAQGKIIYKSGNYTYVGATIPIGIELDTLGSSVVFNLTSVGNRMFAIHGTVRNVSFDYSGLAFNTDIVVVSTGGRLLDCKFYGTKNQLTGTINSRILSIQLANNFRVERNQFLDVQPIPGVAAVGDSGNFRIENSSYGFFNKNLIDSGGTSNLAANTFRITESSQIFFQENEIKTAGTQLNVVNGRNLYFERNIFISTISPPANAMFILGISGVSTETLRMAGNRWIVGGGFTDRHIINVPSGGGITVDGLEIDGNTVVNQSTVALRFVNIGNAAVKRAVLKNNFLVGGFTDLGADSGDTTQRLGLQNFIGGRHQE